MKKWLMCLMFLTSFQVLAVPCDLLLDIFEREGDSLSVMVINQAGNTKRGFTLKLKRDISDDEYTELKYKIVSKKYLNNSGIRSLFEDKNEMKISKGLYIPETACSIEFSNSEDFWSLSLSSVIDNIDESFGSFSFVLENENYEKFPITIQVGSGLDLVD